MNEVGLGGTEYLSKAWIEFITIFLLPVSKKCSFILPMYRFLVTYALFGW